jgi:hypothetical protein
MLSSTVADTDLQLISNTKSMQNTVSPSMKHHVPPGMIDNGGVYEFPDDISDLDGMAKILPLMSSRALTICLPVQGTTCSLLLEHPQFEKIENQRKFVSPIARARYIFKRLYF